MEDPNRMRTKLRLDLNDVAKQIEEIEESLKHDKSPELLEDHRKLVEYEKKLKAQYEKMTGLSIEQAVSLGGAKRTAEADPSKFARFMGILSGFLFAGGYYNLVLYAIGRYTPYDLYNYFILGTKPLTKDMAALVKNLTFGDSYYIVLATLSLPVVFSLAESLAGNSRKEIYSVLEALALTLPTVYLIFLIALPNAVNTLTYSMFNFAILFAISGLSLFLSGFGGGKMNKLFGLGSGIAFFYSAYQAYITSTQLGNPDQVLYNWPYIFMPVSIAGLLLGLAYLFGFIKD